MVGIVVVTYNRLELLKEVIGSLRKQTYQEFKIIVINNDSPDCTKEWLNSQADLRSIHQGNVGGAGGFFTGMKYVAENGFDYCWIMDDDVICYPNALEELINGIQVKPEIGFVCSKVIGDNNLPMNVPEIELKTISNGAVNWMDLIDYKMIKVKSATFVSVLFPVKNIFEFGLPLKDYFIWGDDTEYTTRISEKRVCYMVGSSTVHHKRAKQTTLSIEGEKDKNRMKNYFYLFRNGTATMKLRYKKVSTARRIYIAKKVLKLLLRGDIYKASIVVKSQIAALNFNPKIEFPHSK